MPSMTWTSEDVDDFRRFDYYRDAICASFARLTPDHPSKDPIFNSHVRLSLAGEHAFTYLAVPDHSILRTHRDIALADDDNLYLNFMVRGQMRFRQGNSSVVVNVGDVVMVDNARQFVAELGVGKGAEFLVCKLPRGVATDTKRVDMLTDLLARHPLFPAAANLIQYACRRQRDWDDVEIDSVGSALETLVRAMVRSDEGGERTAASGDTLRHARTIIASEMVDPNLSKDSVAAKLKISPRTLQLHLAQCGTTFTGLLNEERCRAVDRLLVQQRDIAISEAAYRVGYTDLSTFYRAYKRSNGRTPRQHLRD